MKKVKQRIDKREPYFVHIGYTYASESNKKTMRKRFSRKFKSIKIRPCVQKRIEKLKRYWKRACM